MKYRGREEGAVKVTGRLVRETAGGEHVCTLMASEGQGFENRGG